MRAFFGKPAIRLPLGTDGKLLPAPGPSARYHGTAVLGFHSGQEAMRFGTLAVIWLKSTFRHCSG